MIGYKGANRMRRRIEGKPRAVRFKLFSTCCAINYFCVRVVVDACSGYTLPQTVTMAVGGVVKSRSVLYMDRFYTTRDVLEQESIQ